MSEWYRNSNGWEDGHEVIDLGYEGDFIAYRRQVMDGRVIYEGEFWDAATETKMPAYLEAIIEGENINHWIQHWVIPQNENQK